MMSNYQRSAEQLRRLKLIAVVAAIALSFVVAMFIPLLSKVQSRATHLLSAHPLYVPFLLVGGAAALLFFLKFPEIAVSLFYVVGFFKGDPRLDATPVDLTVTVAVIMLIAMGLRLFFTDRTLHLPRDFIFYAPILALMFISLTYTPDLAAGVDKTLRFLFLTLMGAISPFLLVDTPEKIRRFLAGLVLGGILMSINSFFMLGGEDRLTAPSGETTALGFSAGLAVVIIWALWFPAMSLFRRMLLYPFVAVLMVALVGSGGRFANVGTAVCIGLSILFYRKLAVDLAIMLGAGIAALPFVRIPTASLDYLASLAHPHQAFGTRTDLMEFGLRTFLDHPLFGVGIQGYRYVTPNPLTYNFPHNLLLELGAELGIFAVIAFLALAVCSYRAMFRVLRDAYSSNAALYRTVFLMLILTCMDASVSGEMNNDRLLFFMLSMPFVLERIVWKENTARRDGSEIVVFPNEPAPLESAYSN
jgi:Lipid A core - O-antigen ligase and related enzymes